MTATTVADPLVDVICSSLLARAVELEGKGLGYETIAAILTQPATALALLAKLTSPANRATLVTSLIDAGILQHSGLWAVPDDPGEEIGRLGELPDTDDRAELDARLDDEGLLREALDRTSDVYSEGEPRPRCARALYEIGDDR